MRAAAAAAGPLLPACTRCWQPAAAPATGCFQILDRPIACRIRAVIDEKALVSHLKANPNFRAGERPLFGRRGRCSAAIASQPS